MQDESRQRASETPSAAARPRRLLRLARTLATAETAADALDGAARELGRVFGALVAIYTNGPDGEPRLAAVSGPAPAELHAPPTRAPSTSGRASSSAAFSGFTEPP